MPEQKFEFWLDGLAKQLIKKYPDEKIFHLNGGLSIRGPQHIGRFRGELCVQHCVKKILEKNGKKVVQYITLYDMDGLKTRGAKLGFPGDPEKQKKYTGVSLFNVPDPSGCCKNWFEHFWKDFGGYLKDFGFDVKIVKTSEFYKMPETKEVVKWILRNRKHVVEVVNRFRGRNPWPANHIPVNPICEKCLSINDTVATGFNLEKYTVDYACKKCGYKGTTSLENAKLNWRLEWIALWKVLHIEFEPYGKDHAAAGGSRETCGIFSEELLSYTPPFGEWNEWVSMKIRGKDLGEMTATGFIGITPKEWLEIAEPEVLNYLYIGTRPHTPITIDLDRLFVFHDDYDRAERIFYGKEKTDERELHNVKRAFELSQIKKPPPKMPFQLSYDFAAQLTQILPEKDKAKRAVQILTRIGQLKRKPAKLDEERVGRRLNLAKNWIEKYAPERYKFEILKDVIEVRKELSDKQIKALAALGEFLEKGRTDEEIWDKIRKIAENIGIKAEEVFKAAYLALLGRSHGPRLVPLIQSLDKDFVVKRFKLEE